MVNLRIGELPAAWVALVEILDRIDKQPYHWSARSHASQGDEPPSESEILNHVMKWKQRRHPPLDGGTVASTIRSLAALASVTVRGSRDLPLPEEAFCDA